jgi:predicted RNase H-related nuclease YkuK (DUF458 family)
MAIDMMVNKLVAFMDADKDRTYRLVIGTDSKAGKIEGSESVDFVTAVVILRQGRGGRYWWARTKQKVGSLRDRIYTETLLSLQVAQELVPNIQDRLDGDHCGLEIHIDVGRGGPTREMIKEVVGMVNGNGFAAKIKPEAFGACNVADKHT